MGQLLSIARAWENAGLDPASATLIEAHGTSTRVGDVAEIESLMKVFGGAAITASPRLSQKQHRPFEGGGGGGRFAQSHPGRSS
ncbi:MAG: hypothetical protein M5U34_12665 [Chloroflexi bacterium]|nr:hypothetical protein [Chloroflexota bacterium]